MTKDMTLKELRAAFERGNYPEGTTGVLIVETEWVESLETLYDYACGFWWNTDPPLTYRWDSSGRDDLLAEAKYWDAEQATDEVWG